MNRMALRGLFVYLVGLLGSTLPVFAEQAPLSEVVRKDVEQVDPAKRIFEIDKMILLEIIKLIRFNVHFHQENNRRWVWRDWLYPAEKETGTALTFAHSIVEIQQRSRGYYNPDLISTTAERKALNCDVTGHAISGTASALELAQNGLVILIAKSHGYSQRASAEFVKVGIDKIDGLLAERARLLSTDNSSDRSTRVWQGRLLKHMKNQVIYEFTQWSISSREVAWREGVFFAIDALQNYTTMAGGIVGISALTNSGLGGPGAIVAMVGHSMETVNPFIRTMAGRLAGKYQRWRLSNAFSEHRPRTMEQLFSDWKELEPLVSTKVKNGSLDELAFLVQKSHEFDHPLDDEVKKIERLRRVADQQAISGPMIGLSKVADSTCSLVAFYHLSSNEISANRTKLAGNITDASGLGYSLLATPTAKIAHYMYTKKLAKKGQLPSQILKARLESLDRLESQVKSAKASEDFAR